MIEYVTLAEYNKLECLRSGKELLTREVLLKGRLSTVDLLVITSLNKLHNNSQTRNTKGGSITVPLTSCLTSFESALWQLTIFCIYLQNRLLQTSKAGGKWYSDTSPFSIPCLIPPCASISGWTQTLNFGMVIRVSYHCAVAHFHH